MTPQAEITSKRQLVAELLAIGYRIDARCSFNYLNNFNKGPAYAARHCYVVEADTGIGFANVAARRDANFRTLQEWRGGGDVLIKGRLYEL